MRHLFSERRICVINGKIYCVDSETTLTDIRSAKLFRETITVAAAYFISAVRMLVISPNFLAEKAEL